MLIELNMSGKECAQDGLFTWGIFLNSGYIVVDVETFLFPSRIKLHCLMLDARLLYTYSHSL